VGRLVDALHGSAHQAVWLDDAHYCQQLLAPAGIPWWPADDYGAFCKRAVDLLGNDVIVLSLEHASAAYLDDHAALQEQMRTTTNALRPLRALLADEGQREYVGDLARQLRAAFPRRPVVLAVREPGQWAQVLYHRVHGPESPSGGFDSDFASVYVADHLRVFESSEVDSVLIDDEPLSGGDGQEPLDCAGPVAKVAAHYRWDFGVRTQSPDLVYDGNPAYVIGMAASDETLSAAVVPEQFWTDPTTELDMCGDFLYAHVPPQIEPERALERLAVLRSAGAVA
jgi:hypothetical protein